MKKAIFILAICAIVCGGCWKHGKYKDNGYEMFSSWNNATKTILDETVNLAFISNAWINGNDSVKRTIEDLYFPTTRIRHDGDNEYGIYRGTQLLLAINTGGKQLDETNANWLITRYTNYDQTYNSEIRPVFFGNYNHPRLNISNLGNNQWSVALDSLTCSGSTSNWTISLPGTSTPVNLFNTAFTLSGTGVYLYDGSAYFGGRQVESPVTMRYEFVTPMRQHVGEKTLFEDGVVDIIVSKATYDDLTLRAEVTGRNQWNIIYRGQKTSWSTAD